MKFSERIREGHLSFLGQIMIKHRLDNIMVIGKIESERGR